MVFFPSLINMGKLLFTRTEWQSPGTLIQKQDHVSSSHLVTLIPLKPRNKIIQISNHKSASQTVWNQFNFGTARSLDAFYKWFAEFLTVVVNLLEPEFGGEQEMLSQSLKLDVLGRPRNKPVPLPAVIKGGKPGAIPNSKVQIRSIFQ